MLAIVPSRLFKRQLKLLRKRDYDLQELDYVITLLQEGRQLPAKYRDHALAGERKGQRDCHVRPDWLLIYEIREDDLILALLETGTHSDLGF